MNKSLYVRLCIWFSQSFLFLVKTPKPQENAVINPNFDLVKSFQQFLVILRHCCLFSDL